MNRKAFTKKLAALGVCPFVIQNLSGSELAAETVIQDDKLQTLQSQKLFVENWLADLLDSMDKNLDRETQEKIVGYCGKACFNRFQFKKDIAINGSGNLDKLIESYSKNFEIWKEGDKVHIRYGKPFHVEIAESLRRGGKTCHFIVHLD